MSAGWLLLNAAYVVYTGSALFKDILALRSTLLGATFLYMAYGLDEPNWSVFFWNIPVAILHIYAIVQLIRSRRGIDLDDEAEAIRVLLFPELDRASFNTLWHCGEERTLTDVTMITQGELVPELYLTMHGEVQVDVDDAPVRRLGHYRFVGEISTFTDGRANATVSAFGTVRLRVWNKADLAACGEKHPEIRVALLRAMGQEVARKLR